jgi:ABC-2 type transport system ATP-binding protein
MTPKGACRVKVARAESLVPVIVRSCDAAGIELTDVSTHKPSLDEVYLSLTGREFRGDPEGIDDSGPGRGNHGPNGGR